MQNWEVVKKKISEMSKDEFVEFISKVGASDIREIGNMCDIKDACNEVVLCSYDNWKCEDCLKLLLNKEYQPPKHEKWIVHRTLRRKKKEIYFGIDVVENGIEVVKDFDVYEKFEQPLVKDGWDVIVFIPSEEEDSDRITCGNALIAKNK